MIEKLEALNKARTREEEWSYHEYTTGDCNLAAEVSLGTIRDQKDAAFIVAMANCADEIIAVLKAAMKVEDEIQLRMQELNGLRSVTKQFFPISEALSALEAKIKKELK